MDKKSLKELLASMINDSEHTSVNGALVLQLAANPQLDRNEARNQIEFQERNHFVSLRATLEKAFIEN
jgi:hypothetical protein